MFMFKSQVYLLITNRNKSAETNGRKFFKFSKIVKIVSETFSLEN